MEAALISAATGALKPVIGKLGALLSDKYKRFKGVRKDINSLTNELAAMDAFLMKMSKEEDPDVQDKVWMNEVRELSYFMEDCIDDFMVSVDDKDAKPDGFIEKMKRSLGTLGKMKARRRIGNEIHGLKKQISEVAERNQRYKTREFFSSTKNTTIDPRALAMFEDASKLVGIDEPKADIIKLLTQGASKHEQLKLVSIVGCGGLGKTTLANQVYQDLKGAFDCRAFLSVSRNPDMMSILRIILSEITGQGYANTKAGSIQQLIGKITNFLAGKRYFVVIDDIWDVDAWDVIKLAFPMMSSGSFLITTTRINDVAKSCCSSFSGDIYGIRHLNMVHSRQLFHRRLFNSNEDCPSHIGKVSDEILQKCDGLPLAIITMSGLLANKERTEDVWNQVKDSIGRALERNHGVQKMMKILSLSYFDLPPHLKSCLLYMAIFPEDSIIWKKGLIRRWIGEGFIHKEDLYTTHEIGERCFNELLNRCLIQPGRVNENGNVDSCRVHDTILDFITSKSTEENFVTLLGLPISTHNAQSKVIRRLSLQFGKQRNATISPSCLVLSHVRSLNVFGYFMEIPSLGELKHLRVLDLEYCNQLEENHLENIVRLLQMRYLNLRNTRISELPEQIGNLGCLEILDLRDTCVKELPTSIVNLGKLSHLLVDGGVKFPERIAKMQALQSLKQATIYIQPLDFIWGLSQLKNLRTLVLDFKVCFYSHMMIHEDKAIASSLCKLGTQNLWSLTIVNGGHDLLHEPLCLLTLKKLNAFKASAILKVPEWVSSIKNLQWLHLALCSVKQDDLCILGALPSLLILRLKELEDSNEKLRINGEIGFRFLRTFVFDAKLHPVDLMFATGSMPKLEKLELFRLHVFEAKSLDFGIKNLPCLITVECEVYGVEAIVKAVKTAMKRAVSTHPNHPTLLF